MAGVDHDGGDTTKHLLEWLKLKNKTKQNLTTPNAGEDVEQQELSLIARGTQGRMISNNTAGLKDTLSVSYKTKGKHSFTM